MSENLLISYHYITMHCKVLQTSYVKRIPKQYIIVIYSSNQVNSFSIYLDELDKSGAMTV